VGWKMKASVARKYGWRPIVSEAQATVLMRRQLKKLRSGAQRRESQKSRMEGCWGQTAYNYDGLLRIKVGTWYKFIKQVNGYSALQLLLNVVDDEKSPVSKGE